MEGQPRSERDADLIELVGRVVTSEGLELVDVSLRGGGGRRVLRVDIDRAGPDGVILDDCQRVSHALGVALDERDLLRSRYVLEVSSPGADRPIRSADDIRRNTGRRIVVRARDGEQQDRLFRGKLLGCDAGCLVLSDDSVQDGTVRIPLEGVLKAQQELEI